MNTDISTNYLHLVYNCCNGKGGNFDLHLEVIDDELMIYERSKEKID